MGLSAKRLGERIGLTAEQTNVLLKEAGFQKGEAGDYVVTDKGKKYAEEKSWTNGYGGYAARGYDYNEWNASIIDKLDTSSANLEKVRKITSQKRKERREKNVNSNFQVTQSDKKRDNYSKKESQKDSDSDYDTYYDGNDYDEVTSFDVGMSVAALATLGYALYRGGKIAIDCFQKKKQKNERKK